MKIEKLKKTNQLIESIKRSMVINMIENNETLIDDILFENVQVNHQIGE